MLDADNMLEPQFVERALAVFRAEPDLAYVSCWLRFIGPDGSPESDPAGYSALGNRVYQGTDRNLDGDSLAMLPRRVFTELGYGYGRETAAHPDWHFYRRLRADGLFGAVIPEQLARYRVLADSLLRTYGEEMKRRSSEELQDLGGLHRTRGSGSTVETRRGGGRGVAPGRGATSRQRRAGGRDTQPQPRAGRRSRALPGPPRCGGSPGLWPNGIRRRAIWRRRMLGSHISSRTTTNCASAMTSSAIWSKDRAASSKASDRPDRPPAPGAVTAPEAPG